MSASDQGDYHCARCRKKIPSLGHGGYGGDMCTESAACLRAQRNHFLEHSTHTYNLYVRELRRNAEHMRAGSTHAGLAPIGPAAEDWAPVAPAAERERQRSPFCPVVTCAQLRGAGEFCPAHAPPPASPPASDAGPFSEAKLKSAWDKAYASVVAEVGETEAAKLVAQGAAAVARAVPGVTGGWTGEMPVDDPPAGDAGGFKAGDRVRRDDGRSGTVETSARDAVYWIDDEGFRRFSRERYLERISQHVVEPQPPSLGGTVEGLVTALRKIAPHANTMAPESMLEALADELAKGAPSPVTNRGAGGGGDVLLIEAKPLDLSREKS